MTSDEEAAASDARGYLADDPASFLPVHIGGVFFWGCCGFVFGIAPAPFGAAADGGVTTTEGRRGDADEEVAVVVGVIADDAGVGFGSCWKGDNEEGVPWGETQHLHGASDDC